jgi:hypothetical protein
MVPVGEFLGNRRSGYTSHHRGLYRIVRTVPANMHILTAVGGEFSNDFRCGASCLCSVVTPVLEGARLATLTAFSGYLPKAGWKRRQQ